MVSHARFPGIRWTAECQRRAGSPGTFHQAPRSPSAAPVPGRRVGTSRVNPHFPVPSVFMRSPRSRPVPLQRRKRAPGCLEPRAQTAGGEQDRSAGFPPQELPTPPGKQGPASGAGSLSAHCPPLRGCPGLAVTGQAPVRFGQGAGGVPALSVWRWVAGPPEAGLPGRADELAQGPGCGAALTPVASPPLSLAAQPSPAAIRTPRRVYLEGAGEQTEVTPRTGALSAPGRMSSSRERGLFWARQGPRGPSRGQGWAVWTAGHTCACSPGPRGSLSQRQPPARCSQPLQASPGTGRDGQPPFWAEKGQQVAERSDTSGGGRGPVGFLPTAQGPALLQTG